MAFEMPHSILPLIMEERRMDKKKEIKESNTKHWMKESFRKKELIIRYEEEYLIFTEPDQCLVLYVKHFNS